MQSADAWLRTFGRLNVYRAKGGQAPHKPLLLLVILDAAERGELATGELELTPELAFQFFEFWRVVAHRRTQRADVRLPFHHLQSDGCRQALDEGRQPSPDKTFTESVRLKPTACLADPEFRRNGRPIPIRP